VKNFTKSCHGITARPIHRGPTSMTGYFIYLTLDRHPVALADLRSVRSRRRVEPGRTPRSRMIVDAHAVEFSKTAKPHRKGFLLEETDPTHAQGRLRADRGV
jgi:hypothetical protein